jgi:hypothetical protein
VVQGSGLDARGVVWGWGDLDSTPSAQPQPPRALAAPRSQHGHGLFPATVRIPSVAVVLRVGGLDGALLTSLDQLTED